MDESRKRVLGIMASILAARKLANYDPVRRVPATMSAIADAVREVGKNDATRIYAESQTFEAKMSIP